DQGQQCVGAVAVAVLGAGLEVEPVLAFQDGEHVGVAHLAVEAFGHHVFVVDQARGVAEQVVDGDAVGHLRQGGQPFAHGVFNREQAVFGQQQDGGRGEGLADGGEAEVGLGGDGDAVFHVGQAVAAAHHRFAVAQHEHGGAGDVAVVVGHDRVDGVGRGGVGGGGFNRAAVGAGGQRGKERDQQECAHCPSLASDPA